MKRFETEAERVARTNGWTVAYAAGWLDGRTQASHGQRRDPSLQTAKDDYARGYSLGYSEVAPTAGSRHHATKKKSPAQLQREINEALANEEGQYAELMARRPIPPTRGAAAAEDDEEGAYAELMARRPIPPTRSSTTRYRVGGKKAWTFDTLEAAKAHAERIWQKSGVMAAIEEVHPRSTKHGGRHHATMMTAEGRVLKCDMSKTCEEPVTHIDDKGFAYCTKHGVQRRGSGHRCRKLRSSELSQLKRGEPLARY